MSLSQERINEICCEPDSSTSKFRLHHAMYRIKNPEVSLDFYCRILGMRFLYKIDDANNKFTIYFLGFEKKEDIPEDMTARKAFTFNRSFALELVHNWGTENDESFQYHNGNQDPKGYGHIGIFVPDTVVATERLEKLGVNFIKKPNEGRMKGIVFIKDPDGYWVELLDEKSVSVIS